MKRSAYTLAEIVIAIGIVGVLAAVMLPMVNKYKPDTTKILYLNTYDALAESIATAADNNSYYEKDNGRFDFSQYPFANLDRYIDSANSNHTIEGGENKLCRVLAENFNITENINDIITNTPINGRIACDNTYTPYNGVFIPSFTNANGVEFMITTTANAPQLNLNRYQTDIIIDINGANDGDNCTIDTCQKPDRFTFRVTADAKLQPTDEMGIRYLETRTNLKYKNINDYNNNSQLASDIQEILTKNKEPLEAFNLERSSIGNGDEGEDENNNEDNNEGA